MPMIMHWVIQLCNCNNSGLWLCMLSSFPGHWAVRHDYMWKLYNNSWGDVVLYWNHNHIMHSVMLWCNEYSVCPMVLIQFSSLLQTVLCNVHETQITPCRGSSMVRFVHNPALSDVMSWVAYVDATSLSSPSVRTAMGSWVVWWNSWYDH